MSKCVLILANGGGSNACRNFAYPNIALGKRKWLIDQGILGLESNMAKCFHSTNKSLKRCHNYLGAMIIN